MNYKRLNLEKEKFYSRLKHLNINKKDFARISNVPYSTVNNWGTKGANGKIIPVPSWVLPFLLHYEKSRKLDYIVNDLCGKLIETVH